MNPLSIFNMPNRQAYCQNIFHLSSFFMQVDCLRLDQIHPILSGNKPLKLQGWLQHFQANEYTSLLSFGGIHSNHLHALAYAGKLLSVPVFLVVRGYEQQPLTPTLQDCKNWGAQIIFADKKTYALRYDKEFQQQLAEKYHALVIGEGGGATHESGNLGEQGCEPLAEIAKNYEQVWLMVGSGTTALGLARGLEKLQATTQLVGVNAVADQGFRQKVWRQEMPKAVTWQLIDDAHCGGFARTSPELLALIQRYDALGLPLDPVYNAKLFYAFEQRKASLAAKKVLLIHGGGLQGRRGFASLLKASVI